MIRPSHNISLFSLLIITSIQTTTFAAGECSRKAAEAKVAAVCAEITKLGEGATDLAGLNWSR